jgi:thiamine kinase-like enzyme
MNAVMIESRVSQLITQIPALTGATKVTALGGLTNRNYRVDTSSNTYVMRVSNVASALLGINRNNERINTDRAHQSGVGAAIIDSLPNENVLVMQWIEAKTLHAADLQSEPDLLPRIAASLKTLHAGPTFEGQFHFPSVRTKYLETVLNAGYFLPENYLQVEPKVSELEKILSSTAEALVPCNNDLLAENFMDDGNKIWIIDFEYSGQNEASFEIGNLVSESFLTDEQVTVLCDAYWGKHLPSKINRALAWSMIARYGWVLWASIQEATSPIAFDFRSWGMTKWNSVLPELEGSRYRNILESLKNDA